MMSQTEEQDTPCEVQRSQGQLGALSVILDIPSPGKRNDSEIWTVSLSKMLKVKFYLKDVFSPDWN
jgi:hypothetical protein